MCTYSSAGNAASQLFKTNMVLSQSEKEKEIISKYGSDVHKIDKKRGDEFAPCCRKW
eukprot:TRINITY_DN1728_c0_g1_i1.p1 TRINITY_DN1728_c0_g1~~TRINITY_DN1728_c0_g1_i1.p1  ORF type:complete len:57 (-),score=5.91 TRINITY_DN1728_c0_g1_i1:165-335(-)